MICRDVRAIIKNVEHEDSDNKFIVAKAVRDDNMLWYYGRYATVEKAMEVAKEITYEDAIGIVFFDDISQIRDIKTAVDCAEEFIKHNELKEADTIRCKSIAYDQIKENIDGRVHKTTQVDS